MARENERANLRHTDLAKARLGPYPFRQGIIYYEAVKEGQLSSATIYENCKKLRLFATFFENLRKCGAVKTADPRHLGNVHIQEFIIWMRGRNLSPDTQAKYLQILDGFLSLFGNYTMMQIRKTSAIRLPHKTKGREIRALTHEELQAVFDAADRMEGWPGTVIRGYLALAFGTACRPNEIMTALAEDVDTTRWRFYIRNPKGNGNWARPQWIDIIRGDMWPRIEAYMNERTRMIEKFGQSKYLFFNPRTKDRYSGNNFRKLKSRIQKMSGVHFELRELRNTYASLTVQGNTELLKPVSMQLRHTSVKTTEAFYARISEHEEIEAALGDRWKQNPIR